MTVLTDARRTILNSIRNYSGLADGDNPTGRAYNGLLTFEDGSHPLSRGIEPALSELPAIAVIPAGFTPEWVATNTKNWPLTYQILIWTSGWDLVASETLTDLVVASLYQSVHPSGAYSYIKAPVTDTPPGTSFYPEVGPVQFSAARLGNLGDEGPKVMVSTVTVVLTRHRSY